MLFNHLENSERVKMNVRVTIKTIKINLIKISLKKIITKVTSPNKVITKKSNLRLKKFLNKKSKKVLKKN